MSSGLCFLPLGEQPLVPLWADYFGLTSVSSNNLSKSTSFATVTLQLNVNSTFTKLWLKMFTDDPCSKLWFFPPSCRFFSGIRSFADDFGSLYIYHEFSLEVSSSSKSFLYKVQSFSPRRLSYIPLISSAWCVAASSQLCPHLMPGLEFSFPGVQTFIFFGFLTCFGVGIIQR